MIVTAETLNFAGAALGQPLLGSLSDHFGRRPVLLISMLGSTISCGVLGLASKFWMVLVARTVNGLSGGSLAMAISYIGEVSSDEKLPSRNARISAAVMLGASIGPLTGSLLYQLCGISIACLVAAGINLMTVLCISFFLPESKVRRTVESSTAEEPGGNESGERLPMVVWTLIVARGVQGYMPAVFSTFINPYIVDQLFGGSQQEGTMFFQVTVSVSAGVSFLWLVFLYKPLLKCIGPKPMLLLALVFGMSGGILNAIVFPSARWLFIMGYALWVNAFHTFSPAISTLTVQWTPSSKLGLANGVAQGFNGAVMTVTPFALWPLYRLDPASVFFTLIALFVPLSIIVFSASTGRGRSDDMSKDTSADTFDKTASDISGETSDSTSDDDDDDHDDDADFVVGGGPPQQFPSLQLNHQSSTQDNPRTMP